MNPITWLKIKRCRYIAIRTKAVEKLEKLGPPAIPALIKELRNPNPWVRTKTILALEKILAPLQIHDASATRALIKALKDKEGGVCSYAAMVLGQIHEASATPELIEALKASESMRKDAHNALVEIGLPAVHFLKKAARKKENACIRDEIYYIIKQIHEQQTRAGFGVRDGRLQHADDSHRFKKTAFPARPTKLRDERLITWGYRPKTFAMVAK